jgi:hypothetical protein
MSAVVLGCGTLEEPSNPDASSQTHCRIERRSALLVFDVELGSVSMTAPWCRRSRSIDQKRKIRNRTNPASQIPKSEIANWTKLFQVRVQFETSDFGI